ncbi:MAG TPA: sulfatase-like hydrolase/transferase [Candidatus Saccharibacteria bacterium]|nr:sulfatase-like hydrolase/transferase [Candidatus Saccharibacteria bacterium]
MSTSLNSSHGFLNLDYIGISEVLQILLLCFILAFFVTLFLGLFFTEENRLSHLVVSMFTLTLLLLYQDITNSTSTLLGDIAVKNNFLYRALYLLFILMAILVFSLVENRLKAKHAHIARNAYVGLGVALVIMATFNVSRVVAHLVSVRYQENIYPNSIESGATTKVSFLPNIYYIVLDRYSSNEQLEKSLNYDNSQFTNNLKSLGFYLDDNAYSAYPYTAQSIASTLNADYLNSYKESLSSKQQTYNALFSASKNSSVAKELKKLGYQYHIIGNWYATSNGSKYADKVHWGGAKLNLGLFKMKLTEFEDLFLSKNFITGILRKIGVYESNHENQVLQQLKVLEQYAKLENGSKQGKFIFTHLLLPHPPYVFNANGSLSDASIEPGSNGELVTQKYLNQLNFTNSKILPIIKKIINNSKGKAIVVLLSDEGFYPQERIGNLGKSTGDENMLNWSDEDLRAKYGILAAYHLPKVATQDIEKYANSVNIFRVILNRYFGYKLPYLPKCNFTLTEGVGKPLEFGDITNRLGGLDSMRCSQLVSGKTSILR